MSGWYSGDAPMAEYNAVLERAERAEKRLAEIGRERREEELREDARLGKAMARAEAVEQALTSERQRREALEAIFLMLEQNSGKTDEEIMTAANNYVDRYLNTTQEPTS